MTDTFPLPDDVRTGDLPEAWATPDQRALLHERRAAGARAVEAFRITDDLWVIDERIAPVWHLNLGNPDVLEGRVPVQRMGSPANREAEYIEDDLVLDLLFEPGRSVLEDVDHHFPGSGTLGPTFLGEERRRAIEAERQTLIRAMGPTSGSDVDRDRALPVTPEGTAPRRRL